MTQRHTIARQSQDNRKTIAPYSHAQRTLQHLIAASQPHSLFTYIFAHLFAYISATTYRIHPQIYPCTARM